MSEHTRSKRRLSRFAARPIAAWVTAVAALVVLAVAMGALFVSQSSAVGNTPTPSPSPAATPAPSGPTGMGDRLITAWNAGEGQQVTSLYGAPDTPGQPVIRYIVDSGYVTDQFGATEVESAVTAWHDQGAALTRTGGVVSQGPFTGFPVTWTSSDGTFEGVEVIRVSAAGVVTEEFRIGATASPATSGGPASAPVVKLIDHEITAENTSDGTAAATFFASNAQGFAFRDGALAGSYSPTSSGFRSAVDNGQLCCTTRTGSVLAQGPFVVFPVTVSNAGLTVGGLSVLAFDGSGKIEWVWHIDTAMDQPTPNPSASGS